jgi:hypothetical protein
VAPTPTRLYAAAFWFTAEAKDDGRSGRSGGIEVEVEAVVIGGADMEGLVDGTEAKKKESH